MEKRKAKASTTTKQLWNEKHYRQFNVMIKPELFNSISEYTDRENISRREFLERAIDALSK